MEHYPRIAIVYLSFHCEPYMDDVVSALKKLTYPRDKVEFIIVDNPHPTHGPSVRYIEDHVLPLSEQGIIPHVTLLAQKENLGFSGGNNEGIKWAIDQGFDYVYFHNNDGFVAANALEPLAKVMEEDKTIGVSQSLMLLHPETDLVNSTGNSFHFMGFGYCDEYRTKMKDLDFPPVKDISYASGAALMMRTSLLQEYGLWDEDFFLYHEDFEYSFRLRCAGYRPVLVRDSVFYHKYQFSRSITKFYYMERNRYGVMLMFFKWRTLLLLIPMELALEVGLAIFALKGGWFKKRLDIYAYWLKPSSWKLWLKKRSFIQAIRKKNKVTDRMLMKAAKADILFQDPSMKNPLLIYVGNPVMRLYYRVVVRGLIWW